jgi:hypothetical protein
VSISPLARSSLRRERSRFRKEGAKDGGAAQYRPSSLSQYAAMPVARSKKNLWPQPWSQARRDDNGIEARLHRQVCNGTLMLRQARLQEVAYKRAHG